MFWLIQYAIFGLVAGALARFLHPGRDSMNWVWTMLLGIGGAVLGGWLGSLLGFQTDEGLMSWVSAVVGAILLLVGYHFATTKQTPAGRVATNEDYKRAVFNDLSKGPNG
jgi:uncharacterized membrane protein YeaQ/YmgE (transglycosylase-associated protein family)